MVLCVAIFSKDNSLLFCQLKECELHREQDIQMFLYCSYDIINEKTKMALGKSGQEHYLGSLLLNSTFRSYGYLSNTNVKFLIITEASSTVLKDNDIRAIFKKLHCNYCKAISNPFYNLSSTLNSSFINKTAADILEN